MSSVLGQLLSRMLRVRVYSGWGVGSPGLLRRLILSTRCFGDKGDVEDITEGSFPLRIALKFEIEFSGASLSNSPIHVVHSPHFWARLTRGS